jgi:hypothetical protein
MYYSVHGIQNKSGSNCFIKGTNSLKKALEIVRTGVNSNVYPVFLIAERQRKCSINIGYSCGLTKSGTITLASSAIQNARVYEVDTDKCVYIDPVLNEKDGEIFWARHSDYFN